MVFPWLFRSQRQPPVTITSDTIIPVHRWDYLSDEAHTVPVITFQFNAVLDPIALYNALNILVRTGDWRKIGARIRRNAKGQLEYHIPSHFDEHRPAFHFSSVHHSGPLAEHPCAPSYPAAETVRPTLARGCTWECLPLVMPEGTPRTLNDWLYSDRPLLSAHVVTFTSHTLLTVSYPHVLMDAQGLALLLKGWTAILNKCHDQVPDFQGFKIDPLATLGDHGSAADFGFWGQTLSAWSALIFGLRFLIGLIWYRFEQRLTVIPQAYLTNIREEAIEQLTNTSVSRAATGKDAASAQTTKDELFLSEGDVLLAWWTRMALQAHRASPRRKVGIIGTIDVRRRLQKYFGSGPEIFFLGNAALPLYATASVGLSLASDGISMLAGEIRRAILIQREPDHIEALAKMIGETGRVPLVGSASMKSIFYTNWHQAGYFDVDFSGAVDKVLERDRVAFTGRAESIIPNILMSDGQPMKFTGIVVVGRDPKGDWIVQSIMHRQAMRRFEEQLQGLQLDR